MERVIEVMDENGGKGLSLVQYEDVIVPKFFVDRYPNGLIAEQLKQIKAMSFTDKDIMLCTFPKTGTHWATNLISLLLYDGPMDKSPSFMPNCVDVIPVEKIVLLPSPKVVHTHFMFNRIPTESYTKGKVILMVRNPKDTAISMYFFLQQSRAYQIKESWNHFQSTFLTGPVPKGPYTKYLKSFEMAIQENKDINIHIVSYEDMKQNGLEEMQKLQKYLGYNHSNERLQAILDRCSLSKLRDDVKEGRTKALVQNNENKPVIDIYRKGEIGDWRNYFTVAQSEAFDSEWEAQMKDSMFHFRYT